MLSEYKHQYFNTYFKIPNCNLICFLEGKERQYQHSTKKLLLIQLLCIHIPWEEKNIEKAGKCTFENVSGHLPVLQLVAFTK